MFPDSLITTTLNLTHELDIPLDNSLVTPDILQLLEYVVTNKDYPYIPDPKVGVSLDYLGIDFPDIVYDPRYIPFREAFPDLDWNNLDQNYDRIMEYAVNNNFPELSQYLLEHSHPEEHTSYNEQVFTDIIDSRNKPLSIATLLVPHIDVPEVLRRYVEFYALYVLIATGYLPLIQAVAQYYPEWIRSMSYVIPEIAERFLEDPIHITDYMEMIQVLYSSDQQVLAQLILNVYQGQIDDVRQILDETNLIIIGRKVSLSYIIPAILYISILNKDYDMLKLLLQVLRQYTNFMYSTGGTVYTNRWFIQLIQILFNDVEYITPEVVSLIVEEGINRADLSENVETENIATKSYLRELLRYKLNHYGPSGLIPLVR